MFCFKVIRKANVDKGQCSDRRCRETHFYSKPLDPDIAEIIISSIINTPSLAGTLLSLSHNRHSFKHYLYPRMNLSRMVNGSSPLRPSREQPPLQPHALSTAQPQPPTTTKRPQGGIYCTNVDCNPRAEHPRQGNTECSECLCRNCCQRASASAAAAQKPRARCPVRSHRSKPCPNSAASVALPHLQLTEPHASTSALTSANTATFSVSSTGQRLAETQAEPLVQQDSRYAQPLPTMWQETTHEWLEAKRAAGAEDMAATGRKKAAALTKVVQRQTVNTIIWTGVSALFDYVGNNAKLTGLLRTARNPLLFLYKYPPTRTSNSMIALL